jgi:hypothetical protein
MTTTTTSNFQLQKIDDGTESDTWGARQREDQDRLDDILGGYLSISVAGPSDVIHRHPDR